ncbi:glucosamine-6-phosphate deaminase 2 isoform 2-like protein [Camelus ferus]|nr:glucosamine-6-phosphate deaminase 2 isoform 2-like protein [Camelus ferus]
MAKNMEILVQASALTQSTPNQVGLNYLPQDLCEDIGMDTTLAKARFFGGDLTMALTVGMGTVFITGARKAFALYKAIEKGMKNMWTMSAFK